ncbi:MAG: response regulator, partial [Proteobacteria bacterium]|nr:response regulator [Pseudomonadota bacterium]
AYALKSLDLSRVVEDMTALLESSLAPGVRVVTDFPPRLPVVEGDETQVRQIVMNLITNAREALAERGGTIRVSTGIVDADADLLADAYPAGDRSPGSYAYLEVSDDGPGIDDETRERIFEPFFSTKFSGRGLGLAAVLGIVRGHRAAIRLETGPESGTTFRVLFPLRAGAAAQPAAAEETAPGRGGSGSVLVIDDDDAVLEVTHEFLRRAGLSVVLAPNGLEGLRILKEDGGIGVVVLDFQMPGLDGVEVLREIRRYRPRLPVLVATGYAEEIAAQRVAVGEFTSYIQKPYDPDVLVHRVQDALAGADAD